MVNISPAKYWHIHIAFVCTLALQKFFVSVFWVQPIPAVPFRKVCAVIHKMVPGERDQWGSVMQSQGSFDHLHQLNTLTTFVWPYHTKYSTHNEPPVTEKKKKHDCLFQCSELDFNRLRRANIKLRHLPTTRSFSASGSVPATCDNIKLYLRLSKHQSTQTGNVVLMTMLPLYRNAVLAN